MKLYFSPLACSFATRVALYEAGAAATFVEVDPLTKQTEEGTDYLTVHPLGLVPALLIDDRRLLTENAAILQFVAEEFPRAELAPSDPWGKSLMLQWLLFIATELHKTVFVPLLEKIAGPEVKSYALAKAPLRLGCVERRLADREFLLDQFTVADAYLCAVLNWSAVTPIHLERWPSVHRYHTSLLRRPTFARAFGEERALYFRELERDAPGHP
jgi:glutathione S-transferase